MLLPPPTVEGVAVETQEKTDIMKPLFSMRYWLTAGILALGVFWSLGSSAEKQQGYPNDSLIVEAQWLNDHSQDNELVIVDVRTDKYFDGGLIPGAVRMPWSLFRYNDVGTKLASKFVGVGEAQRILGEHGVSRGDTVVLYDSVKRDGGATASYVFWVLDILGHQKKMILERGVDGWDEAGFERVASTSQPEALLYQAPLDEIRREEIIDGDFVYDRLGDFYYQIVDVRSAEEYRGKAGSKGLDGRALKLGHIPGAVNINYTSAWKDTADKDIKEYGELLSLFAGLDPSRAVIVYCASGRRSSFSYYILRLMGFDHVYTYEPSWQQWGDPGNYYPVETRENILQTSTSSRPDVGKARTSAGRRQQHTPSAQSTGTSSGKNQNASGGYISCGG